MQGGRVHRVDPLFVAGDERVRLVEGGQQVLVDAGRQGDVDVVTRHTGHVGQGSGRGLGDVPLRGPDLGRGRHELDVDAGVQLGEGVGRLLHGRVGHGAGGDLHALQRRRVAARGHDDGALEVQFGQAVAGLLAGLGVVVDRSPAPAAGAGGQGDARDAERRQAYHRTAELRRPRTPWPAWSFPHGALSLLPKVFVLTNWFGAENHIFTAPLAMPEMK